MLVVPLLCEFPEEGLQRKPVDPGHLFQGLKGGEVASRAGHAVAQKHPDRLRPPSEEGLHTSRIPSRWERQGIVSAGRQRLVIRIPHALVEIAEDKEPSGGSG
jgi:hypothetical protein